MKLLRLLGAGFSMSLRRSVAFRINLVFDVLLAFTGPGTAVAEITDASCLGPPNAAGTRTNTVEMTGHVAG